MSSFASESANSASAPTEQESRYGVGNREAYYGKWDKFAKLTDEQLKAEEEEAERKEKERVAHIPHSDAHKRDREKREALKEAKKQWDNVKANEKSREVYFENDDCVKGRVIDAEAMGNKSVLYINNNFNSSYKLAENVSPTKVFVDDCKNCSVTLCCKIVTSVIEVHRCENVNLHITGQEVHTIQVDMSKNISIVYSKDLFSPDTKIYHSSVENITVNYDWKGTGKQSDFKSQTLNDFELSKLAKESQSSNNLVGKDDQFVTAYLLENQELVTDLVLRDGSGHPTTARELEARKKKIKDEVAKKGLDVDDPQVQKYLNEYDPVSPIELASKHKEEGNKAFKECNYRQASVHYTQAIDALHSVHQENGTEVLKSSYSNRAACSLKLGEHENALADSNSCLAIDPNHVKATFRKGMALHALERYREACPVLSKALEMEPKNSQIKQALLFSERRASMPGSK